MTAAEVIAQKLLGGESPNVGKVWANEILDALKANGYAVVKVPARNVSDADCSGACWGGE